MLGFALASMGFGLFRPGFTSGASLAVDLDEQNAVAGMVSSVNGIPYVAAPSLGVALYGLGLPLPFLVIGALMLGLAVWIALQAQGPFGPRGVSMPGRDEADAAGRAVRVLLQAGLDLLIFALHLLGHRGAGFAERASRTRPSSPCPPRSSRAAR